MKFKITATQPYAKEIIATLIHNFYNFKVIAQSNLVSIIVDGAYGTVLTLIEQNTNNKYFSFSNEITTLHYVGDYQGLLHDIKLDMMDSNVLKDKVIVDIEITPEGDLPNEYNCYVKYL